MLCRNMKELRELICQSRLDYYKSDSDSDLTDCDNLSVTSPRTDLHDELSCRVKGGGFYMQSPDSGVDRSMSHCISCSEVELGLTRLANVSKNSHQKNVVLKHTNHEAKSSHKVLPPVGSVSVCHRFDDILDAIDIAVVATWLEESNRTVEFLASWTRSVCHFISFAHFWLSEISGIDRSNLIQFEYGILLDHLSAGFSSNIAVGSNDIRLLTEAVFHEYPRRLLSSAGTHLIIEYLDILMASQHDEKFKYMLSRVHCSTSCRQHTEIVLAIRAFAITSILSAFVDFYRRLVDKGMAVLINNDEEPGDGACSIAQQRMFAAVRNGLTDVVHYLLKSGRVQADCVDSHQRSLIFLSVLHQQDKILKFLLLHPRYRDVVDVNHPADSGNTPLHAAVSFGNSLLVELLLAARAIRVDAVNSQAEDSTPLHVAVIHGHCDIVKQLIAAGANSELKTNQLTALELAHCFGQDDVIDLLTSTDTAS